MKLHRKIKNNEKVCRAHDLGSYAQGQGHNQVRGQNRVSANKKEKKKSEFYSTILNLSHEIIYGPMMTSFYFISYYFLFFAGNVYNCNAYTKRLFETFLQRTVKLFERRRKI